MKTEPPIKCPRCFGTGKDPVYGSLRNPFRCRDCGGSVEQHSTPESAQPSLLELRDKLVSKLNDQMMPDGSGGSGMNNAALRDSINIITSGFAAYVKGE